LFKSDHLLKSYNQIKCAIFVKVALLLEYLHLRRTSLSCEQVFDSNGIDYSNLSSYFIKKPWQHCTILIALVLIIKLKLQLEGIFLVLFTMLIIIDIIEYKIKYYEFLLQYFTLHLTTLFEIQQETFSTDLDR